MAGNSTTIPGIGFSEIDNTVMPNAQPGDGIGAIVINANRGYPNQRVLCTTIDKFHEYFGTPDNPNQYGHFAAQVYFEQGGATQLLAVRATQGDEGYAQIQYPYTDSTDKNHEQNIESVSFVDNNMDSQIKMITDIQTVAEAGKPVPENYYNPVVAKSAGFDPYPSSDNTYQFLGSSKRIVVSDIYQKFAGNLQENLYVYRDLGESNNVPNGVVEGKGYIVYTNDPISGVEKVKPTLFAMPTAALTETMNEKSNTSDLRGSLYYYQSASDKIEDDDVTYFATVIHIPAKTSMDSREINIVLYVPDQAKTAKSFSALYDTSLNKAKSYTQSIDDASVPANDGFEVVRVDLVDWDDMLTKSFVIKKSTWEDTTNKIDVCGIKFTEYGTADSKYMLVLDNGSSPSVISTTEVSPIVEEVASDYGVDVTDIANEKYRILKYIMAKDDTKTEQYALIVVDEAMYSETLDSNLGTNYSKAMIKYKKTWMLYRDLATKKFITVANYGVGTPNGVVKPWQVAFDNDADIGQMYAISSTEVFSDPSGRWKDGYTPACKNDGEPGNGDIEMYQSNKTNQLVIGAIGPGEFGNDVGISIITPEAATIPALYHQNAFSWLYRYDDEDKVNDSGLDYRSNKENLTWKKVYRINVYVKTPSKTQSVWGFGLDALTSSPVESWLVSNDPSAKDENGNSLWAPYVINGNSQYIYVSKKSVEAAVNYKGEYEMPTMTWSIYQMTGGTNSKLNNVKEKTKALDLYKNRRKAYLDYLFNVEPVDTFSGKQKYMAMMNRIGQIAMARKMDLGIIQCTSKEAKTIRLKLSEGKMFSFADGSYVAGYDDYDSYFDPFTSTWVMLPRSVAGAVACCYVDNYDKPWMAPAGVTNGRIQYSDHPMVRLEEDEYGQLYAIHVNSSMYFPAYGEVIMGQKTMLKKESALNRIDVRKLCNFIEKRLEGKLIPYLYQKNTTTNRSSMRTAVDTFMGRIQSGQGIKSRKVEVVPDEKNTHLVYVKISFVPTESIERIEVVLILNRETGTITPVESVSNL